ncbi:catalase family protein [Bradyrhizobium sp. CB1650]|uniref:catalase family protein n=1 Tax=Bradyrhizobium sp. CB1650 TaxID=3039153 RepID=UPI002435E03D|nr:catalase family protein [Bradyrhizobium sp. CB1650]WGD54609.1 catalase family protein [Bradyrhizobium sp. CB1650]
MSADQYLRYDPSVEQIRPDEAEAVAEIVASIKRTSDRTFQRDKHGTRQQHAKGVGFLRGELTVYDGLPDHLRQGLFKEARSYPVIVRLSTAFNKSDRVRSPRGFAIKVLGVTGPKATDDDDSTNQDILLVNHASYFKDTKAYLDGAQRNFEFSLILPDFLFRVGGFASRALVALADKTGIHIPMLFRALGDPGNNILGETFHTEGALRFGDHVARLRVVPMSESLRKLTGQPCHDGDNVVLESVVAFFRENSAEYELRAQLCTDLTRTPIEDASIDWPEDVSEPQALGKITLPRQAADSSARSIYANEVLSFDPWRCLAAHRPLGSIMRVRRDAYRMSRTLRQQQNQGMAKQPPGEPRQIADLPD